MFPVSDSSYQHLKRDGSSSKQGTFENVYIAGCDNTCMCVFKTIIHYCSTHYACTTQNRTARCMVRINTTEWSGLTKSILSLLLLCISEFICFAVCRLPFLLHDLKVRGSNHQLKVRKEAQYF